MPTIRRVVFSLLLLATLVVLPGSAFAQGITPQHSDPFWVAAYWNNTSLSGSAVLQRSETNLDYDWGTGSPDATVAADNFSARWTRYVEVTTAGVYRFTATTDDGVRVWVDNNLIIDQWNQHAVLTFSGDVNLGVGHHLVVMEYFEAAGGAIAKLSWGPAAATITQWRGEYFNNTGLSGSPAVVRNDAAINFNWGTGAPASGVNADNFSVRWTRNLDLPAGTVRFNLTVDDGARLWVNNHLLIDTWKVQAPTSYSAELFHPGGAAPVKLEYFEASGLAVAQLSWTGSTNPPPSGGEVIVDDNSSGFVKGGSPTGWHTSGDGFGGGIHWSYNNTWQQANYNWGRWYPKLNAARYEVYVHIPAHYAGTTRANYWVSHYGGFTRRIVNQSLYSNDWVSLGTYRFRATNKDYVSLNDITGEPYLSKYIAWDAVKFVPR